MCKVESPTLRSKVNAGTPLLYSIYPKNYGTMPFAGSVRDNTVWSKVKDKVSVFDLRSVFYVQFPHLSLELKIAPPFSSEPYIFY